MSEPKFTQKPWRRTITTVPCVAEGYDVSPDIVNLTIDDRNIPLFAVGMNSTVEGRELFAQMVANADLMAAAPEMYKAEEEKIVHLQTLKNQIRCLLAPKKDTVVTLDFVLKYIDAIIGDTENLLAKARGEAK